MKFNIQLKEENSRWLICNEHGHHSWQVSFDEYEVAILFLLNLVKDEINGEESTTQERTHKLD